MCPCTCGRDSGNAKRAVGVRRGKRSNAKSNGDNQRYKKGAGFKKQVTIKEDVAEDEFLNERWIKESIKNAGNGY